MTDRDHEEVRHVLANAAADEPPLRLDMDALVGRARRERRRRRTLLGTVLATGVIAVSGTMLPVLLSPSPPLPLPGPAGAPETGRDTETGTETPVEVSTPDPYVPPSLSELWPAPQPVDYSLDEYAAVTKYVTERLEAAAGEPRSTDGYHLHGVEDRSGYPGRGQEVFSWHFTLTVSTAAGDFPLGIRLDSPYTAFTDPPPCPPEAATAEECRIAQGAARRPADPTAADHADREAEPGSGMVTTGRESSLWHRVGDFQSVTVTVAGDERTRVPLTESQMDDIARRLIG